VTPTPPWALARAEREAARRRGSPARRNSAPTKLTRSRGTNPPSRSWLRDSVLADSRIIEGWGARRRVGTRLRPMARIDPRTSPPVDGRDRLPRVWAAANPSTVGPLRRDTPAQRSPLSSTTSMGSTDESATGLDRGSELGPRLAPRPRWHRHSSSRISKHETTQGAGGERVAYPIQREIGGAG
jgi:hypothetical protein